MQAGTEVFVQRTARLHTVNQEPEVSGVIPVHPKHILYREDAAVGHVEKPAEAFFFEAQHQFYTV